MNKFEIYYEIDEPLWNTVSFQIPQLMDNIKKNTLKIVSNLVPFLSQNKNFSINLSLSNDKTVHDLNKTFRKIDKPTNVLSFANIDGDDFEEILNEQTDIELGDIIISYERMLEESRELEIPFEDHFKHLLVHGILHILGYDHIDDNDRLEMEKIEVEVLSLMNVPDPYQE